MIPMQENTLTVYFTVTQNTSIIANKIHNKVGGDLHQILPAVPYPSSLLLVVKQALKEIKAGYMPALKSKVDNIESYSTIFIGSPNWWNTIAPPVATFLTENDLTGKTIVPFLTHGGGGIGNADRDIRQLTSNATVLDMFEAYNDGGSGCDKKITAWLNQVGINA